MDKNQTEEILEIIKEGDNLTVSDISIQTNLDTQEVMNCINQLKNNGSKISLSSVADGIVLVEIEKS